MRFYCPISNIWLMEHDRTKGVIHVTIAIFVFFVVLQGHKINGLVVNKMRT